MTADGSEPGDLGPADEQTGHRGAGPASRRAQRRCHPVGDELIDPIVTALARRLKRTLQDNQNELLDRLRSEGFTWSVKLLPDETEQLDAYATAALPGLEQAAEAGVAFVGPAQRWTPHRCPDRHRP